MAKHKTGLHKEITSIFDGVPIPKKNGTPASTSKPAPEGHTDYATTKPLVPHPSTPTTPKTRQHVRMPPATKPQTPAATPRKGTRPKQRRVVKTATKTSEPNRWQQILEQITNKLPAPKPGVSAARQKTMVILIPVLSLVLIFVLVRVFGNGKGPHRTSRPQKTKPASVSPSADASNIQVDWQIPAPYPAMLRDPMQLGSSTSVQAETGQLIVKGIVHSEDSSFAVIGTQIVREGDEILGTTIVKINKDSVVFEMNGKRWTQKVSSTLE